MSKALNTEMEWAAFKSKLAVGSIVKGEIFAHMPFGVFVALQSFFLGLIEIPNFKEKGEPMTPREYPELGEPIRAVVMGFREGNHQVALSARPSDIAQSEKRRRSEESRGGKE